MEVFCKDCKHLTIRDGDSLKEYAKCLHPKNLKKDWYSPDSIIVDTPMAINRDNDCSWFEWI